MEFKMQDNETDFRHSLAVIIKRNSIASGHIRNPSISKTENRFFFVEIHINEFIFNNVKL